MFVWEEEAFLKGPKGVLGKSVRDMVSSATTSWHECFQDEEGIHSAAPPREGKLKEKKKRFTRGRKKRILCGCK